MASRTLHRALPHSKAIRLSSYRSLKSLFQPHHFGNPARAMSLMPRFPGAEFSSLFRFLDSYNDHLVRRNAGFGLRAFAPRFDVRETTDAYHLDGELPGIDHKNVEIEFSDPHTLVISGRTERESTAKSPDESGEADTGKYWVSERSVGEFYRTFTFPSAVDQNNVKARLKGGVLSVTVPKSAPPSAKRITIE
jgi:HSP20 family molecular chaperone IbpA